MPPVPKRQGTPVNSEGHVAFPDMCCLEGKEQEQIAERFGGWAELSSCDGTAECATVCSCLLICVAYVGGFRFRLLVVSTCRLSARTDCGSAPSICLY